MIVDVLENAELYAGLHPGLVRGLNLLREAKVIELATGRHEIDGDRFFAMVQQYKTRPLSRIAWEAHRRYYDVQYVAVGEERIGYANIAHMLETQPYDAEKDVALYEGEGSFVVLHTGMFAIFGPQDVHAPCLAVERPLTVLKMVIKVAVDEE